MTEASISKNHTSSAIITRFEDRTRWQLRERIKELTALHKTAEIVQQHCGDVAQTINRLLLIIPPAYQYPETTGARIVYGATEYATENFKTTRWMQHAEFMVDQGKQGRIEVCYLKKCPPMDEGPFLTEERALINSLAELLQLFFQRHLFEKNIIEMNEGLENLVKDRTSDLLKANSALEQEIAIRREKDRQIVTYQQQLRALASEVSLAEERERREIACNLHDHIGQALAFLKAKLRDLQGYSAFSGIEKDVEEIRNLVGQIIHYTRTLTSELSPPTLYELGLEHALSWLAEQFQKKYRLRIEVKTAKTPLVLKDDIRIILYKSVRELLINVVKHAKAGIATIALSDNDNVIRISVMDDGIGCPQAATTPVSNGGVGFGLFSIRERLKNYGGNLVIQNPPEGGTMVTLSLQSQPEYLAQS
jgi:signal transduction histidine kinase